MGYDIIKKYGAGISLKDQSIENIGDTILDIKKMSEDKYNLMCINARTASENYDFKILTDKLIKVVEEH
jgi:glycosyltransferase involved in cell wall biosynthesis